MNRPLVDLLVAPPHTAASHVGSVGSIAPGPDEPSGPDTVPPSVAPAGPEPRQPEPGSPEITPSEPPPFAPDDTRGLSSAPLRGTRIETPLLGMP